MPRKASMLSLETTDPAIANFIHGKDAPAQPTLPPVKVETNGGGTPPLAEPAAATTPPAAPARTRKTAARPKETAATPELARVTYKVDATVHFRLKLLALKKRRKLHELANEALLAYLEAQGAE